MSKRDKTLLTLSVSCFLLAILLFVAGPASADEESTIESTIDCCPYCPSEDEAFWCHPMYYPDKNIYAIDKDKYVKVKAKTEPATDVKTEKTFYAPYNGTAVGYRSSVLKDYEDCRMLHTECRWDCRAPSFGKGNCPIVRPECSTQCIKEYFECKKEVRGD